MEREPSCGKAQRRRALAAGGVGQDASQALSGVGSQGLDILHGGGGQAGQQRCLLSQGISMGVLEDPALLQGLDDPHGGLLDQTLDLRVGGRRHGHEGGLAAVGMGHVHPVQHENVEMRVAVKRGAETLHKGDAAATDVAVAKLSCSLPVVCLASTIPRRPGRRGIVLAAHHPTP